MKNNLNCNGCRYTVEKNRIACDCCVDRSNYSPRQRIRYGEDLDADIYTAIQKAMTNLSVTGTFMPAIENVMFKDPATIVFWADGTKTVVKALYEKFDPEKGLAMAIATYAIRVLPLTLIRKEITNKYIKSFLYYVPYVTLAVMTFPAILTATQSMWSGLIALIGAILLAWKGGNLFQVAIVSCALVFIVELIIV